jgi:hypothetical protein
MSNFLKILTELQNDKKLLIKKGDIEIYTSQSDEDGSLVTVLKNGKEIDSGDYDSNARAFFFGKKHYKNKEDLLAFYSK